jgi:hypothetical protein
MMLHSWECDIKQNIGETIRFTTTTAAAAAVAAFLLF